VERINVGVIGLGEVAQIIHLPILDALSGRYQIAALCDISPGVLAAVGQRYDVAPAHRYTDADDLVAQGNLQAVLVLNSDEYHADCAIAALKHGCHVLVEKPMCLTLSEAEAIVTTRDDARLQVVVAYMRRFAPAFQEARAEIWRLGKINYVRVRDIIGRNRLIIDQAANVLRFDDISPALTRDRSARAARQVQDAIGEAPADLVSAYRLLCGLSSHDLSAMRELLGAPRRVIAASQWNGGRFLAVIFEYDGYCAVLETGVDEQLRFDAHIEVYGVSKSIRLQYDTPYIRHLPTTLVIHETAGDAFNQTVSRPTFKDPYTYELEHFHDVVTGRAVPKTTPEDYMEDLRLFRLIVDALRLTDGGSVA